MIQRRCVLFFQLFSSQIAALSVRAHSDAKDSDEAGTSVSDGLAAAAASEVGPLASPVLDHSGSPPSGASASAVGGGIGNECADGSASGEDVVDGVAGIELIAGDSPGAQVRVNTCARIARSDIFTPRDRSLLVEIFQSCCSMTAAAMMTPQLEVLAAAMVVPAVLVPLSSGTARAGDASLEWAVATALERAAAWGRVRVASVTLVAPSIVVVASSGATTRALRCLCTAGHRRVRRTSAPLHLHCTAGAADDADATEGALAGASAVSTAAVSRAQRAGLRARLAAEAARGTSVAGVVAAEVASSQDRCHRTCERRDLRWLSKRAPLREESATCSTTRLPWGVLWLRHRMRSSPWAGVSLSAGGAATRLAAPTPHQLALARTELL